MPKSELPQLPSVVPAEDNRVLRVFGAIPKSARNKHFHPSKPRAAIIVCKDGQTYKRRIAKTKLREHHQATVKAL